MRRSFTLATVGLATLFAVTCPVPIAVADPALKSQYWQIQNTNGKCLVVQGTQPLAKAFQFTCVHAYDDQFWRLVPDPEGTYFFMLKNLHSGLCLVSPKGGNNDLRAFSYPCVPEYDDQWWTWSKDNHPPDIYLPLRSKLNPGGDAPWMLMTPNNGPNGAPVKVNNYPTQHDNFSWNTYGLSKWAY